MRTLLAVIALALLAAAPSPADEGATVSSQFPTISSGALSSARLVSLPKGVILKSGDLTLTQKDLDAAIQESPEKLWPQLKRNLFFVLENSVTESMITWEAQSWVKTQKSAPKDAESLTSAYLDSLTASITATDEELKTFFDNNKDMVGDTSFDEAKGDLKKYIVEQKRNEAIRTHINSISDRYQIDVDKNWVAKQSIAASDNIVDKARKSGMPTFVDFGAYWCKPCKMMAPIIDALKKDYEGKLNVVFVNVEEQQILGARYGSEIIPLQVFFDKNGKEVFRHSSFFARDKIEAKLAEMGVK